MMIECKYEKRSINYVCIYIIKQILIDILY